MTPGCSEVLFHCAGTARTGLGHVARSANLAEAALRSGIIPFFYCEGELGREYLAARGFSLLASDLEVPPHVILDHPSHLRPVPPSLVGDLRKRGAVHIGILDERGEARRLVDALVDVWLPPSLVAALPACANAYYGFSRAIVHKSFAAWRVARKATSSAPRILVSMGGTEPKGLTCKALMILREVGFSGPLTVVLPLDFQDFSMLGNLLKDFSPAVVLQDVRNMAEKMADCDLVFTKLGQTQLEAFCMGCIPILLEPSTKHLELSIQTAECFGAGWPVFELGLSDAPLANGVQALAAGLGDSSALENMMVTASRLVDGFGTERALAALCGTDGG